MKKYLFSSLIAASLFGLMTQSMAINGGNLYVENDSEEFLYAQFLWNKYHNGCYDSKDGSLYSIEPYGMVSNTYEWKRKPDQQDCDFIVHVFKKGQAIVESQNKLKPPKPITYEHIAEEHGGWMATQSKYILDSHDTPPRICAGGHECSTDRRHGGNHLHLKINNRNNTYAHVEFSNDSDKDLYVNYNRVKGHCRDSVDNTNFKVPPSASMSDSIINKHLSSLCTYNVNVSDIVYTKKAHDNNIGNVCQVSVNVGYLPHKRYIYSYTINNYSTTNTCTVKSSNESDSLFITAK
jgi:hypothetical protein